MYILNIKTYMAIKINPFEICINEKEDCESTIFYHFIKGNKYTIYINFVNIFNSIKFIPSAIIPVLTTTIETKTEGILKNLSPKIYNVDMENKVKYIFFEYYNKILMAPSDVEITKNNLNLIPNLEFTNIDKNNYLIHELSNNTQYWVIIAIPPIFEDKGIATRIAISDYKIENIESEKIIIPSGKSAIIYIPSLDYTEDCSLKFCNILTSYSSTSKNMRYINSINLDKKFDVLLHNYERMPVFIEKSSNEQSIDIKSFYQRYAFFGAVDTEISRIFNNLHKFMVELKELNYYKLEEYLPLSIRVSSDYYRFYEFINLFFNDLEDDLKIYVDKIYGETELYECIDKLNLTDLSILTTPINNCKDKKSIFNRFLSLKGTKTISGYISPNSYFDIFIELNHNDNKIILSPLFRIQPRVHQNI